MYWIPQVLQFFTTFPPTLQEINKSVCSPGIEPVTLELDGECDDHYTTEIDENEGKIFE